MSIFSITSTLLLVTLSIMMLYLYKILINSSVKRSLHKNQDGLQKGIVYPLHLLQTLKGIPIGKSVNKENSVLIITSYSCEACKRIYPYLEELRQEYKNIQLNILMLATQKQAEESVKTYNLENFPLAVIKNEQLHELGITGFPFAYLLSSEDKVIEKGIVNHKKDFELLISYLGYNKTS